MRRLSAIRKLYEPHAQALSDYMKMDLPLWVAEPKKTDIWRTVSGLRAGPDREQEAVLWAGEQVSDRATASHLHDEEHGF